MNELPVSWTSTAVADAFEMDLGKMLSPIASIGRDLKPYLGNRNVQWNRFELDDLGVMNFSVSEQRRLRLAPGDLLICEGGEVGRTAMWHGELAECYFQKAIHRLRPKRVSIVDPRYMLHYMTYIVTHNLLQDLTSQTSIAHLTQEKLALLRIRHPISLGEQRRIAEILDSVDGRVQSSIRMLKKLADMRAGSINDSLRTGSRTVAPLDSFLASIEAGHSPNLEDTPAGLGQWGVLKVSAVGDGVFHPEENKVVHDRSLYNPSICVRTGDLLITRANTPQLVGRSCIVQDCPPGMMLCDKTLRLVVDERLTSVRYIHIALGLAESRRQIENAATGSSGSMKNISQQSIRRLLIPCVDPEDARHVVEIDLRYEARISALQREVARLSLLKRGLIDEVLTGRVRAGGVAAEASLP